MSGSRGQGRRSTSVPASSNVFEADTHGAVQSYPQYHNRREGQQDSLVRSLFDQQYPPNESDYESIVSKLLGRNEMGKQHAQSRSQSTQSSQAQLQRSKQLSENKYDSGNRIWERSTFRQQKLHQMREQIRQERQAEEARECTFQPSINTKSHRLARMSRARKVSSRNVRVLLCGRLHFDHLFFSFTTVSSASLETLCQQDRKTITFTFCWI